MNQEERIRNNKDSIKVLVRIRPHNEKERCTSTSSCVQKSESESNSIVLDSRPNAKVFKYDWVGGQSTTQEEIFLRVGKKMADTCLQGYNCTVFAYGQTGAGKTYTMQGKDLEVSGIDDCKHKGLQPRVFEYLFQKTRESMNEGTVYLVKCSHFEIYNEQIMDLLNPGTGNLQLREDLQRGVFIEGITEEIVTSAEEALKVLKRGARNRHVGSTSMNIESSRSHSVFSIALESKVNKDGMINVITSKFNFVDLAGSERQKSTDARGIRLKEAGNINKSLTVLGSVINALVENSKGKKIHVRYRDSKLTFLLKHSLGGNSKTAIIANVSPYPGSFGETLSTLKFAQRAKLIKNKASINEEASGCVSALKKEIMRLKKLLMKKDNEITTTKESTKKQLECDSWRRDPLRYRETLKQQNSSHLELELLLKESMTILNETELRLQEEYAKKQEFMDLFNKACGMYESKENQMKMMIKFYEEKIRRNTDSQYNGEEMKVNEIVQKAKTLQMILRNTPQIMQVFKENLRLKHQIEYSEVESPNNTSHAQNSFTKVSQILAKNFEVISNLHKKLDSSIKHRRTMNQRFEMICNWTGMSTQDIKTLEESNKNKNLEKIIEELNIKIHQKKQKVTDMRRKVEYHKKMMKELEENLRVMRKEKEEQVARYEERILTLKKEYENADKSDPKDNKVIELKDQLQALMVLKDELIRRTDTAEQKLARELAEKKEFEERFYNRVKTLNSDKIVLEQKLSKKKSKIDDLENQAEMLHNELKTLNDKIVHQKMDNEDLVAKIENYETEKIDKNNEMVKEIGHLKIGLEKISGEKEELEHEYSILVTEKGRLNEELETLQDSLNFANDELRKKNDQINEMKDEIKKKNWDLEVLESKVVGKERTILELQKQLEKQSQSNSPHNIALRENFNLRNLLRELQHQMREKDSMICNLNEKYKLAEKKLSGGANNKKMFEKNLNELTLENQAQRNKLFGLESQITQSRKTMNDLNNALSISQKENTELRDKIEIFQKTIKINQKQFNNVVKALKNRESQYQTIQEELKTKVSDLHAINDKFNVTQLKYFTLTQEFETLKKNSGREIDHLKKTLDAINNQNKKLIQQKIKKEQELKDFQDEQISKYNRLKKQILKYRKVIEKLEKSGSKAEIDELRESTKDEDYVQEKEVENLEKKNRDLKLEIKEKSKQIFRVYNQYENCLFTHSKDLTSLKGNFKRLDNQFKIALDSFRMKDREMKMIKDENKLASIKNEKLKEQNYEFKKEQDKLKQQLLNGNQIIRKISKENLILRSEFDMLSKVYECHIGENQDSDEKIFEDLKENNSKLAKQCKELNKMVLILQNKLKNKSMAIEEFPRKEVLDVEKLIYGYQRMEKLILGSRYIPRSLTKVVKSNTDIEKYLEKMERHIKKITEKEKMLKIKQYDCESKMLRYSILENEINILKQQQNLSGGYYKPEHIIPKAGGRMPEYIRSSKKFKFSNIKIRPERPSILSDQLAEKFKFLRSKGINSGILGKRPCSEDEEDVLTDNDQNAGFKDSVTFAETPVKKLKVSGFFFDDYSGIKENNFDPDNYDYDAATPKKRLIF